MNFFRFFCIIFRTTGEFKIKVVCVQIEDNTFKVPRPRTQYFTKIFYKKCLKFNFFKILVNLLFIKRAQIKVYYSNSFVPVPFTFL